MGHLLCLVDILHLSIENVPDITMLIGRPAMHLFGLWGGQCTFPATPGGAPVDIQRDRAAGATELITEAMAAVVAVAQWCGRREQPPLAV